MVVGEIDVELVTPDPLSCITSFVVRFLADMLKEEFPPNVIEVIRDNFYVDDGHGGDDDLQKAIELKENLKEAMARGGLPLGKWKAATS